jgi:hypothetical protein
MANHAQPKPVYYPTDSEHFDRPFESKGVLWHHKQEETDESAREADERPQAPMDEGSDPVVAHYFSDVQRHSLLSRSEELRLWERIDTCQQRMRRALYVASTTLPALLCLWRQVEQGDLPLLQFVEPPASTRSEIALRTHTHAIIMQLKALETQRHDLNHQSPPQAQLMTIRQAQIETCNALNLHPDVDQTLYDA